MATGFEGVAADGGGSAHASSALPMGMVTADGGGKRPCLPPPRGGGIGCHPLPRQIRKRNADWGPAVVNQKFGDAQRAFIRHVGDAGWLQVTEHRGFEAAERLIAELCAGRADPRLGHVVSLA